MASQPPSNNTKSIANLLLIALFLALLLALVIIAFLSSFGIITPSFAIVLSVLANVIQCAELLLFNQLRVKLSEFFRTVFPRRPTSSKASKAIRSIFVAIGKFFVSRYIKGVIIALLLLIPTIAYSYLLYPTYIAHSCGPYQLYEVPRVLQETLWPVTVDKTSNTGECVGLSGGEYAFDTSGVDGTYKLQASDAYRRSQFDQASSLWQQAHKEEPNDAEPLIYAENLRVQQSGHPFITIVVATMLSGITSSLPVGRDNLQAAYLAQHEYNRDYLLTGGLQVKLLIANMGESLKAAEKVTEQIIDRAAHDESIIGIMGFPLSTTSARAAITSLGVAGLPIISPSASSDDLSNIAPSYFYRVAPRDTEQAFKQAQYIKQLLQTTGASSMRVAVFAPCNANHPASGQSCTAQIDQLYAPQIAKQFVHFFQEINGNIINEPYDYNHPEAIANLVTDALNQHADAIYFAGYSDTATILLNDLARAKSTLPVIGGDALYHLTNFPQSGYPPSANNRLHFTSFASPDEWNQPELQGAKPDFFKSYQNLFDDGSPHSNPYGFSRSDADVMLSYDAMKVLLEGINRLKVQKITPYELHRAINTMNEDRPLQGITGPIAFSTTGDPIHKPILVLYVDKNGNTQIEDQPLNLLVQAG